MHAHANKKSFSLVRQRKRSQAEVKRELRLVDGKVYKLCVEDGKIILAPKKLIPDDQQYLWTEERQVAELEAQAEMQTEYVNHFDSMEDYLKNLEKKDKAPVPKPH
ncbi:hypothetical protein [Desulfosporosinus meridiei]|uniref:Uncharacterized protein n=1 Tax=Desulfosporosinus meridiei (strain ATCC BAA-275 / DSM 13257 / KCTC 12902 / NCIMB 13706 / S10) TaxID=768704 RepID=J7J4Q8_DESMD|nr:hypothetical protein [Desulfosporosinus meridiei]AFQ45926.1 hypothetical protein Desmer_4096 [Desulfosporosinus meridiei DSM 13257]